MSLIQRHQHVTLTAGEPKSLPLYGATAIRIHNATLDPAPPAGAAFPYAEGINDSHTLVTIGMSPDAGGHHRTVTLPEVAGRNYDVRRVDPASGSPQPTHVTLESASDAHLVVFWVDGTELGGYYMADGARVELPDSPGQ